MGLPNQAPTSQTAAATAFYSTFASEAKPDVIYEYHAGNTYQSPIQMFMFQIGFSYRGGR